MQYFQLVTVGRRRPRRHRARPARLGRPAASSTGPNEPNLRVVRELDTMNDDPEMHFTVLVVVPF
jgi:hypothetical protein